MNIASLLLFPLLILCCSEDFLVLSPNSKNSLFSFVSAGEGGNTTTCPARLSLYYGFSPALKRVVGQALPVGSQELNVQLQMVFGGSADKTCG